MDVSSPRSIGGVHHRQVEEAYKPPFLPIIGNFVPVDRQPSKTMLKPPGAVHRRLSLVMGPSRAILRMLDYCDMFTHVWRGSGDKATNERELALQPM
eukprot:scaffold315554_cov28-Tisochrysis_lutea.AAC.3